MKFNPLFKAQLQLFLEKSEGEQYVLTSALLLLFGDGSQRKFLFDKRNDKIISSTISRIIKNDERLHLFIFNKLGIGMNISIKDSNMYLKAGVEKRDVGCLFYDSLKEEARGSIKNALLSVGGSGDSGVLIWRKKVLESGVFDLADIEDNIKELLG
jgi:hypothetical protein